MPQARDLLERLRPIGTPGAAAPAGVPVDRRAGAEAELEPVFAAMAGVEEEVRRLLDEGGAKAAGRRDSAAARVQEILARSRGEAEAERAAVAARMRHQADADAATTLAEAELEAAKVRARCAQRLPSMVATVVDRIRADLDEATATADAGRAG